MLEHGKAHAAGTNDADALLGLSNRHIAVLDCLAVGRMCQFLGTNRGSGGRGGKQKEAWRPGAVTRATRRSASSDQEAPHCLPKRHAIPLWVPGLPTVARDTRCVDPPLPYAFASNIPMSETG